MYTTLTKKQLTKFKHINLEEGQVLFHETDECKYVGIVMSGTINIVTHTNTGNEIIYNVLKQGNIFGNNLLFSKDVKYKGDVIAQSKSEILLISKEEMLKLLKTNDAFLEKYLLIEAENTKKLNSKIKLLSFDSSEERFLFYLKENNNNVSYSSITELAKELGLQRETLSRLISKLVKDKIITNQNKKIRRISFL